MDSTATLVFENFDLMSAIMAHLTYPEVSAMREVNKDFDRVGKQIYKRGYEEARSESQRLYFKYLTGNMGLNMCQKAIRFTAFVDEYMEKNLWPFLVHNPAFAQNIFFRAAEFHPYRSIVHRYDLIHDKIRPYLFIADVTDFTVLSMRQLLSYKGVKGVHRMNKSQLKRVFNSEKNKSFIWNS